MPGGIHRSKLWLLLAFLSMAAGRGIDSAWAGELDAAARAAAEWVERFAHHPPAASESGVSEVHRGRLPEFTVTPGATGRQLVRVSLPFDEGACPVGTGLVVRADRQEIVPDVRILTRYPGQPPCVRRAMVTFACAFANGEPVAFHVVPKETAVSEKVPASRPGEFRTRIGETELRVNGDGLEAGRGGKIVWRAELVAPPRVWPFEGTVEVIEQGKHHLWVRLLVPDERWPRVIELRADALGTVAVRAHVQRLEPTPAVIAYAPEIGWRIFGSAADKEIEHSFSGGEPVWVGAGSERLDFPDAHLLRRGSVTVRNGGAGSEVVYWRCRAADEVPQQYAAWRTATVVLGPKACASWTALLEPGQRARIAPAAFDRVYGSGKVLDVPPDSLLSAVTRYHREAIASSIPVGDDFGNVAAMPRSGAYGMNRLNHCPSIFAEYYRCGDERLREVALHWCSNYYDLSVWWGIAGKSPFGGTRYNNASRHDKSVPQDPKFMWRSNTSVNFCTKGYDTFFFAYEETGDPRMATALRWQVDYARQSVHCNTGECRNIGDVTDFVRLYEFTGDRSYLEEGLRLFRELKTKLSTGDLFDQGGRPIAPDLPYIEDDQDGMKAGYAKPYIIGYALLGLPALAKYYADEPKLHDVIRAVADFLAESQDPVGAWGYPHPRSPGRHLSQAIEHAVQLARAARYLESRGENIDGLLDAIERVLQQRILTWEQSGQFCLSLGGWEAVAGLLKDGRRLSEMYRRPEDRDRSRDYTEGQLSFGDAPPEGVVYFFEVLDFYLAHRKAENLSRANETLRKVLSRIPAKGTISPAAATVPSAASATSRPTGTEDLGNGFRHHGVATPVSNHRGTVATADGQGRDIVLVWLFDLRGGYALLLIDAETGRSEEYPMPFPPGGDCPYASILSSGNKFYTHFNSHFVEFDPVKRAFTFHHETAPRMAMGMTEDDNGAIWSVTYPQSGVVSFDPKTREFRDFGHVHKENWEQYQRHVAADDAGWIYFGIGMTASHIMGFDPATGKARPMIPEDERVRGAAEVVRDLNGKVYGHPGRPAEGPQPSQENWYEFYRGQARKIGKRPPIRKKLIITSSQSLFHTQFPDGKRLQVCDTVERVLVVEDPKAGTVKRLQFDYHSEGAHVMGLAVAPNGTICGGTAFPMRFFSYDPRADKWANRDCYGQWNTIARQGDRFFVGGYGAGFLLEWDPARGWVPTEKGKQDSNPLFLTDCTPAINRPHKLLAHPDGRTLVLAGTPEYGFTGGGLLFWDRATKKRVLLDHTDIIPQQATMSLAALPEGRLLGGTTTSPGTGGERKAEQAELYIMNMATRKLEWHQALFAGAQGYSDLCPGPNGLVYGVVDRARFFVFDPAKRTVTHERETQAQFGLTNSQQGPRVFVTGPRGEVYLLFVKGICRVEPGTFEIKLLAESPVPVGPGGDYLDGRIYFASGSHMYSYKVPD